MSYDSFLYSSITALFPSPLSSPPPPPYILFIFFFSPRCVFSALYITAAHSSNPFFVPHLTPCHIAFISFSTSFTPPPPPPPVLLFPYSAPHTHFFSFSLLTFPSSIFLLLRFSPIYHISTCISSFSKKKLIYSPFFSYLDGWRPSRCHTLWREW